MGSFQYEITRYAPFISKTGKNMNCWVRFIQAKFAFRLKKNAKFKMG